ncbi:hypothetical protein [Pseudomonas moraviensis]|uniref:hypothetical protein n=1 Tax=Pseudomonas moraviensis TaxID=321662 RepID=UPI000F76C916|nr:hypothetical protein [Pseudomonas moraviensis]RRW57930.1 hypothetical protein EGJ55_05780 [Pseudomonas moraviensis]
MTSPTQPPVDDAVSDVPAEVADASETKAEIPAFKFPFKPGELASAKGSNQPWYKNGAKNGHAKTPGMAPPGTRRSMGKR